MVQSETIASPTPPTPKRRLIPTRLTDHTTPAPDPTLPRLSSITQDWFPIVSSPANFSLSHFHQACIDMTSHPEHLSTTILRADLIHDIALGEQEQDDNELAGFQCHRKIRRRLLPKRKFDWEMTQDCCVYTRPRSLQSVDNVLAEHLRSSETDEEGAVILRPDFESLPEVANSKLPYYHPQVVSLAFRYIPSTPVATGLEDDEAEVGAESSSSSATIRIDIIPLPNTDPSQSNKASERIYRSCLSLLGFLHTVGSGMVKGYDKKVFHDLLAKKEDVQDLYRCLKGKYEWMAQEWKEETDPQKHLFEDVAIAAWLIVVWRDMYADSDGKPPGGFVDVGCGNGLLYVNIRHNVPTIRSCPAVFVFPCRVHLLSREGYPGYGLDLRARKSWAHYTPQPDLRTQSLDPPALLTADDSPFPINSFLIANHADELTPWIPLFASRTPGAKFLNIPCCHHTLSGRFTALHYTIPQPVLDLGLGPSSDPPSDSKLMTPFFAPAPNLSTGRAHAFQLYLAHLTILCGFVPEREALRIPSTKNFGFLGRRRVEGLSDEEVRTNVDGLLKDYGSGWTARIPEGKAGLGKQNGGAHA
ncbi:BZ3500_MvSof-1268-A1-R1_Chr7-1g09246 [Microbotryum saponariae]|uniref:tRNA (uracil-O(2)-)-methyltransferase n=1 Tax=Microbotryum saponariae TaxID=289078 RepID=A0A2X0L1L2_9BASI|nr:BZ3501_MvSof-1269-A2-R1_Chr7-1g08951 [Microbotryum saponariae]SDA03078.1 BZ3500_MvSof-1268-A1-R1_Chr7-1g09246 [Microbotryum saponariae]